MTGYILKVEIVSPHGADMESLQFALDFYVERERTQHMEKSDLQRVRQGDKYEYYANIDSDWLRRGHLICKATIVDPEAMWETRERPVVVSGYTGITIGLCNYNKTNSVSCMDYKMNFVQVEDIPKNKGTRIFYGVTDVNLDRITQNVADRLYEVAVGTYEDIPVQVTEGDRLVVLIPREEELVALKSNGLNAWVSFDESIMGANGDIETYIDGVKYRVFGEFMTVSGTIKIAVVDE